MGIIEGDGGLKPLYAMAILVLVRMVGLMIDYRHPGCLDSLLSLYFCQAMPWFCMLFSVIHHHIIIDKWDCVSIMCLTAIPSG